MQAKFESLEINENPLKFDNYTLETFILNLDCQVLI